MPPTEGSKKGKQLPTGTARPAQSIKTPEQLQAEADKLRHEEAGLRARADGLQRLADAVGRKALELDTAARQATAAQTVVPFESRKRWGRLAIVDPPSEQEIERSADPAAVERAARDEERAVAATERVRQAVATRRERGTESRRRVGELWPVVKAEQEAGGRKTKDAAVAGEVANRLKQAGFQIEGGTVLKYKPRSG